MSLWLRLLTLGARLFVKPALARARGPEVNRRMLRRAARRLFRAPPHALYREDRLTPELRALWIAARPGSHPVPPGKAVLYFHGGGFIAGAPETHAAMLARLARIAGVEVCAPAWRYAPEHPFPAGVEDARAAWDALIARGYRPHDVVLAGDSAGGNLALGLLAALCAEGMRPAGAALLAPMTDFTFSGASMRENAACDCMLPAGRAGDMARWYLAGAAPDDPRASPLFAAFDAPPPVLLHYAGNEILRDDSRRMAAVLRAAGGVVVERVWPEAPHAFQLFDGLVPEARESLCDVAAFVRDRLGLR